MARAKKVPLETPVEAPSGLPTGVSWNEVVTFLAEAGFSPKNLVRVAKTPLVYVPEIEGDSWAKVTWSFLKSELTYTVESLTLIRKEAVRMIEVKDVTYEERE
ncbi:hypothetical protein V8U11_10935 [Pseudomonas chlororaphis]|uniref:hypothetical protein n=1 Tax=Pseudomonas chlororaphis TaxID=587753 RepID=UPI0030CDF689